MSYEILDHTADLCLRVEGVSFSDLLQNAAIAMIEQITDREGVQIPLKETIQISGDTKEEILVRLLSEIMYLIETKKLVFKDIKVWLQNETGVKAELLGQEYDPSKHELLNDIKAVTYHGLKVKEVDDRFTADIVFDI